MRHRAGQQMIGTTTWQAERSAYMGGLRDALAKRIERGNRTAVVYGHRVRILSIAKTGVRCRFPDGHIERIHPEDVK